MIETTSTEGLLIHLRPNQGGGCPSHNPPSLTHTHTHTAFHVDFPMLVMEQGSPPWRAGRCVCVCVCVCMCTYSMCVSVHTHMCTRMSVLCILWAPSLLSLKI